MGLKQFEEAFSTRDRARGYYIESILMPSYVVKDSVRRARGGRARADGRPAKGRRADIPTVGIRTGKGLIKQSLGI